MSNGNMRNGNMRAAMIVFVLMGMVSPLAAEEKKSVDIGKTQFDAQCAVCHGTDAKGGGLYVPSLKVAPPDLTVLAKKNGGVFPAERVIKVIDGRQEVGAHGTRDMPIWGKRFAIMAGEHYVDVPYDQEAYIRAQTMVLADYVYRLQEK